MGFFFRNRKGFRFKQKKESIVQDIRLGQEVTGVEIGAKKWSCPAEIQNPTPNFLFVHFPEQWPGRIRFREFPDERPISLFKSAEGFRIFFSHGESKPGNALAEGLFIYLTGNQRFPDSIDVAHFEVCEFVSCKERPQRNGIPLFPRGRLP